MKAFPKHIKVGSTSEQGHGEGRGHAPTTRAKGTRKKIKNKQVAILRLVGSDEHLDLLGLRRKAGCKDDGSTTPVTLAPAYSSS